MPSKTKGRTYSFRLTNEEAERFERMGLVYSARNAFAKKSDLIRAWLNVDKNIQDNAKLTKEERDFLSGLRDSLPEEKHVGRSETFGVVDIPKRPRGRKVN